MQDLYHLRKYYTKAKNLPLHRFSVFIELRRWTCLGGSIAQSLDITAGISVFLDVILRVPA